MKKYSSFPALLLCIPTAACGGLGKDSAAVTPKSARRIQNAAPTGVSDLPSGGKAPGC